MSEFKFKIGDRVRITTDNITHWGVPKGTCGTVDENDDAPFVIWDISLFNNRLAVDECNLELITEEKTMDNLQVGDVLVNAAGDEYEVRDVLTNTVFVRRVSNPNTICYDIDYIKEYFELKDTTTPKEMTVAEVSKELGYEVKIVK